MKRKILVIICILVTLYGGNFEAKSEQGTIIKIDNQSNSNQSLANSKFTISDESGNVIQTLETDKLGIATSDRLPAGSYEVEQTVVSNKFELNPQVAEVTIDNTMSEYTIVFKNIQKYGSLTVQDNFQTKANANNNYQLYKDNKLID